MNSNKPLSHTAVMNLWNYEADKEQRTEVRTFWFDSNGEAEAFAKTLDGDVRFHVDHRSPLGTYRVVSYRPV
jgi:hypothetical protein